MSDKIIWSIATMFLVTGSKLVCRDWFRCLESYEYYSQGDAFRPFPKMMSYYRESAEDANESPVSPETEERTTDPAESALGKRSAESAELIEGGKSPKKSKGDPGDEDE